jgi:hypothetical protein
MSDNISMESRSGSSSTSSSSRSRSPLARRLFFAIVLSNVAAILITYSFLLACLGPSSGANVSRLTWWQLFLVFCGVIWGVIIYKLHQDKFEEIQSGLPGLVYNVTFGNKWRRDEVGWAGKGIVNIDADAVRLTGKRQLPSIFESLIIIITSITVVIYLILVALGGMDPGSPLWFVVIGFVLLSYLRFGTHPLPDGFRFSPNEITEIARMGTSIKMKDKYSAKYHVFTTVTEEEARDIETLHRLSWNWTKHVL